MTMPYYGALLLCVAFVMHCGCLYVSRQDNFEERLHFASRTIARMKQENATIASMWQDHLKLFQTRQKRTATPINFPCNIPETSRPPPTSVHDLHPEDIRVVGAMGDSLTAASGAMALTILGLLRQDRGRSWSVGGDLSLDRGVLTMPNILKQYSPNLRGYSTGSMASLTAVGGRYRSGSRLNVAEARETSNEMPMQARTLVGRIRRDSLINMTNDWKMVTVFVGANDLCKVCREPTKRSPATYVRKIKEALDILHAELPRTFVNLVEVMDITIINEFQTNLFCEFITTIECGCGRRASNYPLLRRTTQGYQRGLQELIATRRYDTRDDFTVVLQPFFRNLIPRLTSAGQFDMSYFAPDCFHFSEKAHQSAAATLWNTMFQPLSQKTTSWNGSRAITCPEDIGRRTFATHMN